MLFNWHRLEKSVKLHLKTQDIGKILASIEDEQTRERLRDHVVNRFRTMRFSHGEVVKEAAAEELPEYTSV